MPKIPEFVVDGQGKRVKVILDIEEYEKMMAALKELEDVRAYDRAKASGDTPIPLKQALDEIERSRG